jgi:hypothetical protein
MARPHIEPFVELNTDYRKFRVPGFVGSEYKVLSLDPDTGACSLKVRFNGVFRRPPGLSFSDVEIFLLNGVMRVGDGVCVEGHYFFVPAGVSMPAIEVPQGCEALVFFNDSEPHFEASDAHHPLALKAGYISVNSYEDRPWTGGSIVSPSTASGLMLKLLRYDPLTEAMTFLYCIAPEYMQDNISYHDCAEESYHIWGTSWMMQFGDLPTGGYFWRPPYINHGSFRSKLGCIALGRTDSKLHNYFHFNPWTNPAQNLHRAASFLYRQRPQLFRWVWGDGHNHPHGPHGQLEALPAPPDFECEDYASDPQVDMLSRQVYSFLEAPRTPAVLSEQGRLRRAEDGHVHDHDGLGPHTHGAGHGHHHA